MKQITRKDIDYVKESSKFMDGTPHSGEPMVRVVLLREVMTDIDENDRKTFSEFIQGLALPSSIYSWNDESDDICWTNRQVYALLKDLRDNIIFNRKKAFVGVLEDTYDP